MNQEELQNKKREDYEQAIERILTESTPGESNLVALLSINLKLLLEKTYNEGWNDGFRAGDSLEEV